MSEAFSYTYSSKVTKIRAAVSGKALNVDQVGIAVTDAVDARYGCWWYCSSSECVVPSIQLFKGTTTEPLPR